MNDISFPYTILRNWENLPFSVELGEHSDLDLLVYDLAHWKEIFPDAKQVYPDPRVQFKLPIGDSFIQIDVRYIGDGYYPTSFEKILLETKIWNKNGFFTPNSVLHRIALAYHSVHHKNQNKYQAHLGDTSVEELLKVLKESDVGWVEPSDPTVGRFNSYLKGATATIEKKDGKVIKKQTSYKEYDLITNEARILEKCNSQHFPTLYKHDAEDIKIEDCGDELTVDNLPVDWDVQLIEIMQDLKKYNIKHNDIKLDNLMVKNNVIKLIDFGWSSLEGEDVSHFPQCLGLPNRLSSGLNDNYSMGCVIKQLKYKLHEKKGGKDGI